MKAKAAVFMGAGELFDIREFDVCPAPGSYGRLELVASGVCGTDIHFHKGKLAINSPTVIGHEFVGKLTDLDPDEGEVYGLKVGDYVIADIAVPCGECLLCKNGDDANCVNMKVTNGGDINTPPYLYGGYTEVNFTPLSNLVKIPDGIDPVVACVFACPGPTAMHSFSLAKRAGVDLTSIRYACVQGLGPVGMYALMYLKAIGVPNVYVITNGNNEKREGLAKKFGAKAVLNLSKMSEEEITDMLKKENMGLGLDLVFEASGSPKAVVQGMDILRNRGVYLIPGQYSNSGGITIQPQLITFKALQILGSSQYSMDDVKEYLEFLSNHKELFSNILSMANIYPVSEANKAFSDAEAGLNGKTVFVKG